DLAELARARLDPEPSPGRFPRLPLLRSQDLLQALLGHGVLEHRHVQRPRALRRGLGLHGSRGLSRHPRPGGREGRAGSACAAGRDSLAGAGDRMNREVEMRRAAMFLLLVTLAGPARAAAHKSPPGLLEAGIDLARTEEALNAGDLIRE